MSADDGAAIVLRGVGRRFVSAAGPHDAVRDLDLDVAPGEFLTLLGPSGSGKTTLLRMVAGLERPDTGTITVDGRVVHAAATGEHVPPQRRGIGMVFQSYAVWPHLTVFENVAYPLRVRRLPRAQVCEQVERGLALVKLDGLGPRRPSQLSGGQQQRVALARALVQRPRVLLLDEPFSGLDAALRDELGEEVRVLQQDLGMTLVYVTHDRREALRLSDRMAVLSGGALEQVGRPLDLLRRPATRFVATFLAETNLVDVTAVEEVDDTGATVRTALGRVRIGQSHAALTTAAGGDGWAIGVRVADVEVERAPDGERADAGAHGADSPRDDGRLVGTVAASRLRGATVDVRVVVGEATLDARVSAAADVGVGDRVLVRLPADRIVLVR